MEDKRRWGRVKVPEKKLCCRIAEPENCSVTTEFMVDNINPGGLSFFSGRLFAENEILHLLIKFPFTTYEDAGKVWGRVVYCLKIHDKEEFVVGVAFTKHKKLKPSVCGDHHE
ncbi:MAG: hypothetical protein WDL87_05805 [Candidatus Omnitrophota bacterium]